MSKAATPTTTIRATDMTITTTAATATDQTSVCLSAAGSTIDATSIAITAGMAGAPVHGTGPAPGRGTGPGLGKETAPARGKAEPTSAAAAAAVRRPVAWRRWSTTRRT